MHDCIPALPDWAYRVDDTSPSIVFPSGRFCLHDTIRITRPIRISAHDTTLVAGSDMMKAPVIYAFSEFLADANMQLHASGTIIPLTDTLEIMETPMPDFTIGEVVLLRCGVRLDDPAEPEFQTYATIKSIGASSITFTLPLGRELSVYSNYEELLKWGGEGFRYKVGKWERTGWGYSRGLGTDHGIVRFKNGTPVSGISIEGLTIETPDDVPAQYGSHWGIYGQYVRNVGLRDLKFINPRNSCVHSLFCENFGVDGMRVSGSGEHQVYQNGGRYAAHIFSIWGGNGLYCRNIYSTSRNTILTTAEVGSEGTIFENCYIKTGMDSDLWGSKSQFGVYGPHPGITFRNIRLDIPTYGNSIFISFASHNTVFENLAIEGPNISDWLPIPTFKFLGVIRIGDTVFGPEREYEIRPLITHDGFRVNYPDGLIKSARIEIPSRDGFRAITVPDNLFAWNPDATVFYLPINRSTVPIGPLTDYQPNIYFWTDGSKSSIPVAITGTYFPRN